MSNAAAPGDEAGRAVSFTFGAYTLNVRERSLERDGGAVPLGSRALDLLIALVRDAGVVISKQDLMARVWPDATIEEVGLRVHVANLRKALGDGKDGARYIANIPGRGYSFVAPLGQERIDNPLTPQRSTIAPRRRLPPKPSEMVGRADEVQKIAQGLLGHRLVTITGAGGIGKTTVAVAIAHALSEEFSGDLYFVDLASVSNPELVAGTVVSALGATIQSGDAVTDLLMFLRDRRALVLMDNCEHVIGAVAPLVERVSEESEEVHIVATSREPLRVNGERVHRLLPLACPPEGEPLTLAEALTFPAVKLFVDRALAADGESDLGDDDASAIAMICRMLDGIALAIELAASQVNAHGIQGLADLISNRLGWLIQGKRTAPSRHQTLQAMIDWSYDLLPAAEQQALSRLSRFSARFGLQAARAMVSPGEDDLAPAAAVLGSLVSKSLVVRETAGKRIRYRLLETTREYARLKLNTLDAFNSVARQHALYLSQLLDMETNSLASDEDRWLVFSEYLGDMRAALEWSFSDRGDMMIARTLARKAVPLFHELSLLSECNRWAERALALLGDENRGSPGEMELQTALAFSLMFTKGNSDEVRQAFMHALALAETLDDDRYQLRLNGGLHMYMLRTGDLRAAHRYALRCAELAARMADGVSTDIAHALLSVTYHLIGDLRSSQLHVDAALRASSLSRRGLATHFGFDLANRARISHARMQWLRGYPDQAVATAQATLREAAELEHPVSLCIALIWTLPVFFWVGDYPAARSNIEWFIQHYERHNLAAYYGVGVGLNGALAMQQGDYDSGTQLIRESLAALRTDQYGLVTTMLNSELARGLAAKGEPEQALELIERQSVRITQVGELFYTADLLRVKGDIQTLCGQRAGAEQSLIGSLEWARRQEALSWELKAAISLARLYSSGGEGQRGNAILAPIYARFTEGFKTADLIEAAGILQGAV